MWFLSLAFAGYLFSESKREQVLLFWNFLLYLISTDAEAPLKPQKAVILCRSFRKAVKLCYSRSKPTLKQQPSAGPREIFVVKSNFSDSYSDFLLPLQIIAAIIKAL
jgi:hypothetical protein